MPTPARDSRREIRRVWCFCWSSADATTSSTSSSSSSTTSTEADCARKRPERPTRFRGGRSVEWAVPAVFHGPCCSFFLIASGVPDSFRVRDAIWRRFWPTGGLAPEQERRTFLTCFSIFLFSFFLCIFCLFLICIRRSISKRGDRVGRGIFFFFNLFFFFQVSSFCSVEKIDSVSLIKRNGFRDRILSSSTGYLFILLGFHGFFSRSILVVLGLYRVLPGFTGFSRFLLIITGFYLVLTRFY